MDNATKCQTHSKGLHYGREHIERDIYNEKGFCIGSQLFEEIVRCKDCKHWDTADHECYADRGMYFPEANDFCSCGERSEE